MYADHFSINNIPYGIASNASHPYRAVVTRLEDQVIFLAELAKAGLFSSVPESTIRTFLEPVLNPFAALPKSEHKETRSAIQTALRNGINTLPKSSISHISDTTLHLPLSIGDFTDFSCSLNHVLNASEAVFGKREAPPGFLHFPVAYTARTSSIVVSGTPITRPKGQFRDSEGNVVYGATRKLDYELEIAAVIGKPSQLGESVRIEDAEEHIFGVCLLNDWSARDIQALEMNPLGPLNGKSFGTSISPWIITLDALAPFRAPFPQRDPDVEIAEYLQDGDKNSSYEFKLSASIQSKDATEASVVCESQFSSLYWTLKALVAHQTINGCNLNIGDLLATGTISGNTKGSRGCLMELASSGGVEFNGANGEIEKRGFLEDGDEVILSALAGKGVGFGVCVGRVVGAKQRS